MTRGGGMPEKAPTGAGIQAETPAEQADLNRFLNVLAAKRPQGKMAEIRWLWPVIVEALGAGHTLKNICEHLNQYGLDISYSLFRHYAARLRHREATRLAPKRTAASPARTIASTLAATPDRARDAVPSGVDPLANLRERLANRPGFQFEERPPDDSKLI